MTRTIGFAPPFIGEDEIQAVAEALRSGWLTAGPRVQEFESAFGTYVGADATHAVSSCTAALHLALIALGVGPGDAVATSSMTFCSTVNVIEQVGAYPILLDVDPCTLNLDATALQRFLDATDGGVIRPEHPYFSSEGPGDGPPGPLRLTAVLPVHYGGLPVDTNALDKIAEEHGLLMLEDAAHALPASSTSGHIGSTRPSGFPHATAFSFYATKNLAMGEGGAITGQPDIVARAKGLSLHGMTYEAWRRYSAPGAWSYDVPARGFKYNMTDVEAAIGLVQLAKLDQMWQRRHEIAGAYTELLATTLAGLAVPAQDGSMRGHAHHLFVVHLPSGGIDRSQLISAMAAQGVATSVHFRPVHQLSYYANRLAIDPAWLEHTNRAARTILSLPLHPGLDDDDVAYVVDALRVCLEQQGA